MSQVSPPPQPLTLNASYTALKRSFSADPLRSALLELHQPRFHREPPRAFEASEARWRERLSALWSGRKVAVWGAAITGFAAAQLLAELGAEVTLSDSHVKARPEGLHPAVKLITGAPNQLGDAELVVPSPGLKPSHPLIKEALARGANLMSEIELAMWCTRGRLIAITGTDGKSTTTCLIEHLLKASGLMAWGLGNLGVPISVRALSTSPEQVLVCEVSAFQLWSTQAFPAELCVITNVAEDHLDYFDGDFTAYRGAKLRLAELSAAVGGVTLAPSQLELDQLSVRRFAALSQGEQPAAGVALSLRDEALLDSEGQQLAAVTAQPLIGRHNQLNICAALLTLRELGLPLEPALEGLKSFKGLSHRMALTRVIGGARWVNDSKATNVHASLAGLKSVDDRLVVILGGKEKQLNYAPLIEHLSARASRGGLKRLLLIGELAPRLEAELSARGLAELSERCDELSVAVQRAALIAESGDMVLLSPASSSFDQFKSFEERGERFESLVWALNEA